MSTGKRTFLLTNSSFEFVDAGMQQLTSLDFPSAGEDMGKLPCAPWRPVILVTMHD